jgi:hypothetical protein
MMIPTIHSNGSGKAALLDELHEAGVALDKAIEAVQQVTVHGRDYYVQGPAAYTQAREEMDRRLSALRQVQDDLFCMYAALDAQGGR